MTWTQFWDMHSGGELKEPQQYIYIEAPEEEARIIFYNRFGHSPDRVSCTCCGSDYSVDSEESLEKVTWYRRGADYDDPSQPSLSRRSFSHFQTLEEYLQNPEALFIYAHEITDEERQGTVPNQGYVWVE